MRIIFGLLFSLVVCSSFMLTSNDHVLVQGSQHRLIQPPSGLLIANGVIRGSSYTDSIGETFTFRHIPITITNDTTIPINVRIEYSKEYLYPENQGPERFRVFPLPHEWARGQTPDSTLTRMHSKLSTHIEQLLITATIEPGESMGLAIGIVYPSPDELWWVVPDALFALSENGSSHSCDWLIEDQSSVRENRLALKIRMGKGCRILPCGQFSYEDN